MSARGGPPAGAGPAASLHDAPETATGRRDRAAPARRGARPWWRRPWAGPLALLAASFLAFALPPYATLDPAQARLPLHEEAAFHYPVLVGHIFCGAVAMVACCLQVWPHLRKRYPAVHRASGRTYVLAVAIGAPLALVTAVLGQQGLAQQSGNALASVLWLGATLAGFRAARRRDFAAHREWMIRSFALCYAIVASRVWLVACLVPASLQLETVYGGDEAAMIRAAAGASVWLSWVTNLLIAEWWLRRGARTRRPARRVSGTARERTG